MSRIAVVGAGISGLACADLLGATHDVVLFEVESRLGGHARTLDVETNVDTITPVDTGFIVYNEVNYPLLKAMFRAYGVSTHKSDMSFGVTYNDGELEYCSSSVPGLFAQPKNLVSRPFLGMLADILKFFKEAETVFAVPGDPTLEDLIRQLRLGPWFKDRFLIPMGAAIWSTPPEQMLAFPAKTFVRFFKNHNLLTVSQHHQWRTVTGGSRAYVETMKKRLGDRARTGAPVARVEAHQQGGFNVIVQGQPPEHFDEVVFATHADQALRLIAEPTRDERQVLGAFGFRDNLAVLHRDKALMPKRKAAWASWVYAAGGPEKNSEVQLTYWMNQLQGFGGDDIFVTLNPTREIPANKVIDRHVFRHPVFSREAVAAQQALPAIQGQRGLGLPAPGRAMASTKTGS